MTEERKHTFEALATALAVINFLTFMAIASYLGGDAFSGKVEDGHYYVASHGHYTEVSHVVYLYSKLHALSIVVTHLLPLIIAHLLSRNASRGGK